MGSDLPVRTGHPYSKRMEGISGMGRLTGVTGFALLIGLSVSGAEQTRAQSFPSSSADSAEADTPRILMREDVADAATELGFRPGAGQPGVYRIQWDGGEALSLVPPVRIGAAGGSESLRYLRMRADGGLVADSLPMDRIRSIETPGQVVFMGETPYGAMVNTLVPWAIAGANPLPLFLGLAVWGISTSHVPEFRRLPVQEYLRPLPRWTGTFSATLGSLPRRTFNPDDPRRETAPTLRFGTQAGSRRSAAAFELGLRVLRLRSPLVTDPPILPDAEWNEYPIGRSDSLYALQEFGMMPSLLLNLTWWESPRATVFTRTGVFWSLGVLPEGNPGAGPEFGAGFDLWLTPSWGLRGEGELLMPVYSGWDISLESALSLGIAYRLNPGPSPSRQFPVLLSLMHSIPASTPAPMVLLETALDPNQRLGLGAISYASPQTQSTYTDEYYTQYSSMRQDQLSLMAAYGLHTNDTRRAHVGFQIMAGLMYARRARASSYQPNLGERHSSNGWDQEMAMAFILSPEAGVRLGAGFGLRAQWHLLDVEPPFGTSRSMAFAAGITYSLPGSGERR